MGGELAQDKAISIARFYINGQISDSPKLPVELIPMRRLTGQDISNPGKTVPIGMRHMTWQLNGRTFEMQDYTELEKIPVNTVQRIRIFHDDRPMGGRMRGGRGGGMGMMMSCLIPFICMDSNFRFCYARRTIQVAGMTLSKTDSFIAAGKILCSSCLERKLKLSSPLKITPACFFITAIIWSMKIWA